MGVSSALDDVDFHGVDVDPVFRDPGDGGLDFGARPVDFEANDADLVVHAGLANVGDDVELFAQLPDNRALYLLRRVSEPDAGGVFAESGLAGFGGHGDGI